MMQSVHYGTCPLYLADTVFAIGDNPTRPGLRYADSTLYPDVVRPWASVHSPIRRTRMERSAFNTS